MKYQVNINPNAIFCLTVEGDNEHDAIEIAEEMLRELLLRMEQEGDVDWVDFDQDDAMTSEVQMQETSDDEISSEDY